MGSNLFSTSYAAEMAEIRRELLESWLQDGAFATEHFAENTKTRQRTYYFAPSDVSRLAEFAAAATTQSLRPTAPTIELVPGAQHAQQ